MKFPSALRHAALKRYRHQLLSSLLAAVGRTQARSRPIGGDALAVHRVLIVRPVHSLGNLLALTSLLTELEQTFPGAEVDVAVALPIAGDLFCKFPQVGQVFLLPRHVPRNPLRYLWQLSVLRGRRYDLVINPTAESNSGRILAHLLGPRFALDGVDQPLRQSGQCHFARAPVLTLRQQLATNGDRPLPPLDLRLDAAERQWGKATFDHLTRPARPDAAGRLALFTGGTGDKRLQPAWWQAFHDVLRQQLDGFEFIEILPADGQSALADKVPTFYSTHLRRVAAVISAADAFVGTDSGIMHLASAANRPTIGLFTTADPVVWSPFGPAECLAMAAGPDGRRCAGRACPEILRMVGASRIVPSPGG